MFGLPLLISYYAVWEGLSPAPYFVVVYVAASLAIGLVLLLKRNGSVTDIKPNMIGPDKAGTGLVSRVGPVAALGFGTVAVISFGAMRFLIGVSYPYPSSSAPEAGGVYVVTLFLAAAIGIPFAVSGAFPVVGSALAQRRLRIAAYLLAIAYFVTYEILVNEILITGYNAGPGNYVQPPMGTYPYVNVMTNGPSPGNFLENAIYNPYVVLQLSPNLNFIFQPFELVLAVAISVLVASTVVSTYSTVKESERMGGACSASATLSGVGAFLGYTATCPSCLAPTLISVAFGGLSSVQALYSNIYGAVVPPVVSIAALLFSLYMISRARRLKDGTDSVKV